MVQLDYYSPWYHKLPEWHTIAGLFLALLWLLVLLRLVTVKPEFTNNYSATEKSMALWVKRLFYISVVVMVLTGYLIVTAGGDELLLFDSLKIPAISHFSVTQIDNLGLIHEYTSYSIMVLLGLHILAALKHHFIDKDETLKRML